MATVKVPSPATRLYVYEVDGVEVSTTLDPASLLKLPDNGVPFLRRLARDHGRRRAHDWGRPGFLTGEVQCRRPACGQLWPTGISEPVGCVGTDLDPMQDGMK